MSRKFERPAYEFLRRFHQLKAMPLEEFEALEPRDLAPLPVVFPSENVLHN